jgi:hypothetical protein
MRIVRIVIVLLLFGLALLPQVGCSKPILIIVYNNTSHAIDFYQRGAWLHAPHGSVVEVWGPVRIRRQDQQLLYSSSEIPIPSEFYEQRGGRIIVRKQLEPDFALYLLKRDAKFPVKNLRPQPENYPLNPVRVPKDEGNRITP